MLACILQTDSKNKSAVQFNVKFIKMIYIFYFFFKSLQKNWGNFFLKCLHEIGNYKEFFQFGILIFESILLLNIENVGKRTTGPNTKYSRM